MSKLVYIFVLVFKYLESQYLNTDFLYLIKDKLGIYCVFYFIYAKKWINKEYLRFILCLIYALEGFFKEKLSYFVYFLCVLFLLQLLISRRVLNKTGFTKEMLSLNASNLNISSTYPGQEVGYLEGTSIRDSLPNFLKLGYRMFTGKEVLGEKVNALESADPKLTEIFLGPSIIGSSNVLFVHPSGSAKIVKAISTDMMPEKGAKYLDVDLGTYLEHNYIPITESDYDAFPVKEFTNREMGEYSSGRGSKSRALGIPTYDNPIWIEIAEKDQGLLRKLDGLTRNEIDKAGGGYSPHGEIHSQKPHHSSILGYFVNFMSLNTSTSIIASVSPDSAHGETHRHFGIRPTAEVVQLKKQAEQPERDLEFRLVA